jgi:hypothetical protein
MWGLTVLLFLDEDHGPHHAKDLYLDECEKRSGMYEEPLKQARVLSCRVIVNTTITTLELKEYC